MGTLGSSLPVEASRLPMRPCQSAAAPALASGTCQHFKDALTLRQFSTARRTQHGEQLGSVIEHIALLRHAC